MRKFVFTLEAVLKYKIVVEKTQKAALADVNARLNAMRREEQELLEAFERARKSQREVLRERVNVQRRFEAHALFFMRLREEIAALCKRIEIAEAEREKRIQELLITTRELKSYRKLRAEQYAEYLKEVQAEEERDIGEFVARNAAVKS